MWGISKNLNAKSLDIQKFGWKINKKGGQKLQHFEKEFVFSKNFDQI